MSKTIMSFMLGFIACGLVCLIVLVCYSKTVQSNEMIKIEQQTLGLAKDTSSKNNPPTINDLKMRILNGDEKLNSTNKRFDDLYILGGIIITLLIAINI